MLTLLSRGAELPQTNLDRALTCLVAALDVASHDELAASLVALDALARSERWAARDSALRAVGSVAARSSIARRALLDAGSALTLVVRCAFPCRFSTLK